MGRHERASRAGPGPSPILWNYSNDSPVDGGVRLYVTFERDHVVEVSSWVRTLYRDLRDSGPRPMTFRLNRDGSKIEGREFAALYCPE